MYGTARCRRRRPAATKFEAILSIERGSRVSVLKALRFREGFILKHKRVHKIVFFCLNLFSNTFLQSLINSLFYLRSHMCLHYWRNILLVLMISILLHITEPQVPTMCRVV